MDDWFSWKPDLMDWCKLQSETSLSVWTNQYLLLEGTKILRQCIWCILANEKQISRSKKFLFLYSADIFFWKWGWCCVTFEFCTQCVLWARCVSVPPTWGYRTPLAAWSKVGSESAHPAWVTRYQWYRGVGILDSRDQWVPPLGSVGTPGPRGISTKGECVLTVMVICQTFFPYAIFVTQIRALLCYRCKKILLFKKALVLESTVGHSIWPSG